MRVGVSNKFPGAAAAAQGLTLPELVPCSSKGNPLSNIYLFISFISGQWPSDSTEGKKLWVNGLHAVVTFRGLQDCNKTFF